MTPNELEAYDAMTADRDRWRERAEREEIIPKCPGCGSIMLTQTWTYCGICGHVRERKAERPTAPNPPETAAGQSLAAMPCSASWATAITGEESEECEYRASWRTGGLGLTSLWEADRTKAKAQISRWWSEGKTLGVMGIETRIRRVETFTQNAIAVAPPTQDSNEKTK